MTSSEELISLLSTTDISSYAPAERMRVQRALVKALRRSQLPFQTALDHVWIEPATVAFVHTLINAGFWKAWVAAGGKPSSLKELSTLAKVDPALLERMLRFLATQELIDDKNGDGSVYELTDYSRALAGPVFPDIYAYNEYINRPGFANFPAFAEKTGYKNPEDPTNTNFKDWWGKGDLFAYLSSDPKIGHSFNQTMAAVAEMRVPWVDIYPTETIIANAKPSHALVVDIGGGTGHDIEKFRAKHPDAQGLVLQDVPSVIEQAKVKPPIKTQAIDMFQSQPVQGARVYFLKTVVHDWPDSKAVEILKVIKKAMTPGYSRILLYEAVISNQKAGSAGITSDVTMMVFASAKERTEEMWHKVVSDAGLKITKIWSAELSDSIIEIELP